MICATLAITELYTAGDLSRSHEDGREPLSRCAITSQFAHTPIISSKLSNIDSIRNTCFIKSLVLSRVPKTPSERSARAPKPRRGAYDDGWNSEGRGGTFTCSDLFQAELAVILLGNPVALASGVFKLLAIHDLHCATGLLD
jgi:hypothetical protein